MKIKELAEISPNYTGIIEWEDDSTKWWIKNGELHREDGPAIIRGYRNKEWWLYDECIWHSDRKKLDLSKFIILSKKLHPLYPTCQLLKYLDKDKIQEQIIIPGMEKYFIE